ncbi:MAG: hypothetical protein JST01_17250 [Cyanobacteria bacterium SZAS TMP-1]|nr:hypothetical protein [Cyanobacteria bacterium SZAS TMP-1]
MLEKFAPNVAHALERAKAEARLLGHRTVRPVHLLLAFAAFPAAGSLSDLMTRNGLDYKSLRERVRHYCGSEPALPEHFDLPWDQELTAFLDSLDSLIPRPAGMPIAAHMVYDFLPRAPVVVHLLLTPKDIFFRTRSPLPRPDSCVASQHVVYPALSGPPEIFPRTAPYEEDLLCWKEAPRPEEATSYDVPMACGDFSAAANFAVLFARLEAAIFNSQDRALDSESLLVGIAAEQGGLGGKFLRKYGVTVRSLRRQRDDQARAAVEADLHKVHFTPMARSIIRRARKFSRMSGHDVVTTVELLWAIVTAPGATARDLLALQIADLPAFGLELQRAASSARYEGIPLELDVNRANFDAAFEKPLEHRFNLALLQPSCHRIIDDAIKLYSPLSFLPFDGKFVLLGLLNDLHFQIGFQLSGFNVTRQRAADVVAGLEFFGYVADFPSYLKYCLGPIFKYSFFLAQSEGLAQVAPVHLFRALSESDDPRLMLLFDRLNLHSSSASGNVEDSPFEWNSYPGALKKNYMPELESVMSVARDESLKYAAWRLGGEFLLLGFLQAGGKAGEALKSLGLTFNDVFAAVQSFHLAAHLDPCCGAYRVQLDSDLQAAFRDSIPLAQRSGSVYVYSEHLLWTLIRRKNPGLLRVFSIVGINPDLVLTEIKKLNQSIADEPGEH